MGVIIAVATPRVGFESALVLARLGVAVVVGGSGIVYVVMAHRSPPVQVGWGGSIEK